MTVNRARGKLLVHNEIYVQPVVVVVVACAQQQVAWHAWTQSMQLDCIEVSVVCRCVLMQKLDK